MHIPIGLLREQLLTAVANKQQREHTTEGWEEKVKRAPTSSA